MSDRLEQIKRDWLYKNSKTVKIDIIRTAPVSAGLDMGWLISEMERLKTENERLKAENKIMQSAIVNIQEELCDAKPLAIKHDEILRLCEQEEIARKEMSIPLQMVAEKVFGIKFEGGDGS